MSVVKVGVGILLALMVGTIAIVFGAALAPTVISNMTTAVTTTGIGSFSGAAGIGVLIPFLFFVMLIFSVIGLVVWVVYQAMAHRGSAA